ncbi:MAG: HEAT repeat protein/protein-L-isoaspartate O-methyltransferase [Rhodothermales bacterium]|jgi:HEAT repeat protein/protein-L-isoaspartate O-methyltransferase
MKTIFLLALSLPLLAAPAAELVDRMPTFGANARFEGPAWEEASAIYDELLAGGEASILGVVDLLIEPSETPNFKPRYVLHGLAQYLARGDKELERNSFLAALGKAVDDEKRPVAIRGFLLRQMQVCGGKSAIPLLATAVRSPQLSEYAVQALAAIGEPAAARPLIAALNVANDNVRKTIVQGLGQLGSLEAVPVLIAALKGDSELRVTAAHALAEIGAREAIEPLLASLAGKPGFERAQLSAAALALAANSAAADSARIYRVLGDPGMDAHVQMAALAGLGDRERILEAAGSADPRWRHVAVNAAALDSEVDWLAQLPSQSKAAYVDRVARIRPDAQKLLAAAATHAQADVRRVAAPFVDGKTILFLLEDEAREVRDAARLAALMSKDSDFDAQLTAAISDSRDPGNCISILADRRATASLPELVELTKGPHRAKATAAIGAIGDASHVPLLLDLLNQKEGAAESALSTLGRRVADKEAFSTAVIAARTDANSASLLKVIGQVPSKAGLAYLRGILKTDQAIDAVRALERWPTPEPAADLLAFAKSATDTKAHVLAFRGYLNMLRMENDLPGCKAGLAVARRVEEKRAILGLLGRIHSAESLVSVRPFIDVPKLAADAGAAAVEIGRRLGGNDKAVVRAVVSEALLVVNDRQRTEGEKLLKKLGGEIEPPSSKLYLGRQVAQTMHWMGAEWLLRAVREREEATSVMIRALELKPGQVVADLGCGNGYHSLMMARLVGETGKIYGVDIQKEMLTMLTKRAAAAEVANVVPVLGKYWDPNLPANSIDVALIVDAYHEFSHPTRMLKGIYKALKPDGVVVFLEYRMEDPEVPIKKLHKMSKAQVNKELVANGFKLVKSFDELPWQHMLWYGKE